MGYQRTESTGASASPHQFFDVPGMTTKQTVNAVISALSAGAAIGSIIMPGLGTVVGALLTAVIGGLAKEHSVDREWGGACFLGVIRKPSTCNFEEIRVQKHENNKTVKEYGNRATIKGYEPNAPRIRCVHDNVVYLDAAVLAASRIRGKRARQHGECQGD